MEQNRIIHDDERTISIKVILANVLKQWRKLIIIMLLFGIIATVYKGYKLNSTANVSEENVSTTSSEEQISASEKEVKNTADSIKMLNDYIKNSIYASIDPYNEIETSADIAIITSSGTDSLESLLKNTNHANQIAQSYATYILKNIDYDDIANQMDLSSDNVKEVISAKPDFNTDIISLSVIGTDSKQTQIIADFIVEQVNKEQTEMKTKYGDHSIVISSPVTNTKVDTTLLSTQATTNTTASYSNNAAMTQAITRLNTLKTNLSAEQKALTSISANTTATSIMSPKILIKYCCIGMVLGLVLAILYYAIKFACEGKITSEDDIKSIFGLKILSVLPMLIPSRNFCKLDAVAYRKIDNAYGVGKDIAIEKAMMNISGYAGNKKSILLIGSDLKQNLEELQDKLQGLNNNIKFNVSNNINADSNELAKLKDTDGVIIVAERNVTRIDDFTKSVETIYNWNKDIIGSIVL